MSYKFQIGSAALSGAVIQRLGTALNSQYVFQDDGGTSRLILKAGSKGSISGSGGVEFTTGSFTGLLQGNKLSSSQTVQAAGAISAGKNKIILAADGGLKIAHMDANWTNAGRTVADMGIVTTMDLNGGTADSVVIGGATPAAASFTTLSASSTLDVVGVSRFGPANLATISAAGVISGSSLTIAGTAALEGLITTNGGLTSKGTLSGSALTVAGTSALEGAITTNGGLTSKGAVSGSSTLSIAGAVQLDGADDGVAFVAADHLYFRDAGTGQMRRDSFSDVMEVAAGTVTATGIENTSGVLSLSINGLGAEVIATGDTIVFNDSGDNGLHKETVDDLFTKGPALATEAVFAVADDYINFLDGGATGDAKKEKWADIAVLIAGAGITATNGVLSSDASPTPNALVHNETLSEGLNYVTGTKNATVFLPQGADFGDTIRLKSQALGNGKVITVSPKAGGGTTIDGEASIALRSQYGAITMIYALTGSWLIV
jgi:hypothetical protein